MTLIHRDLTSAFKLLRDRSTQRQSGFYDVDGDEKGKVNYLNNEIIIKWDKVNNVPFET